MGLNKVRYVCNTLKCSEQQVKNSIEPFYANKKRGGGAGAELLEPQGYAPAGNMLAIKNYKFNSTNIFR